jgi:hypothetical protein
MTGSSLPFVATPVAQSVVRNTTAGIFTLDVTTDVRAFLAGSATNQGWLLKLNNETLTGTLVFYSRESQSKPRLILSVLKKIQVPPQAPDSIPVWMYSDTNIATSSASIAIPFTKRIVVVEFKPDATQDQRTAAVAAVGGTVIGGIRIPGGEGHYYVRIEDVVGDVLLAKAAELRARPEVASAFVNVAGKPLYRVPTDGEGWGGSASWRLRPDLVDPALQTWPQTAINAPLAWGCSTGDPSVTVGIVDVDFRVGQATTGWDDLRGMPLRTPAGHLQSGGHGAAVAGLLAAAGNNTKEMTGIMWQADARLYDYGSNTPSLDNQLEAAFASATAAEVEHAGYDGAQVINLSSGIGWADWGEHPLGLGTLDQQQARDEEHWALRGALQTLAARGHRPLLVLAAGNDGLDASWSGYPLVRDAFPGQVIVVGATRSDNKIHNISYGEASDTGRYVDIVAPGEQVPTFDDVGNIVPQSGTSLSAPLVSGIAGLLFSFDPRLTTAEVRQLIMDGAARSNRVVDVPNARSYYLADAYESLKLAAERPGAPLCGNRLWSDGTNVQASRAGEYEPIFAFDEPVYGIMELAAHHGGRRIDLLRTQNGQKRAFTLNGQTWSENPSVLSDSGSVGGVWRSLYGYSHDGVQAVFADMASFDAGTLRLKRFDGNSQVDYPGSVDITPALQQPDTGCAWKIQYNPGIYTCAFLLTGVDEDAAPVVTFSPIGDRAVAGYSVWKTTVTPNGDFSPCPWSFTAENGQPSDLCVESITYELEPVRAEVFTFPLIGGSVTPLFSLTGSIVETMEMTEDGTQVIVQEGLEARTSTIRPGGCGDNNPTGWCNGDPEQITPVGCQITYRSTQTGQPIPPDIPTRQSCINGGVGSASPSVGAIGRRLQLKVPSFLKTAIIRRPS